LNHLHKPAKNSDFAELLAAWSSKEADRLDTALRQMRQPACSSAAQPRPVE